MIIEISLFVIYIRQCKLQTMITYVNYNDFCVILILWNFSFCKQKGCKTHTKQQQITHVIGAVIFAYYFVKKKKKTLKTFACLIIKLVLKETFPHKSVHNLFKIWRQSKYHHLIVLPQSHYVFVFSVSNWF
jgi:hypothetical protein